MNSTLAQPVYAGNSVYTLNTNQDILKGNQFHFIKN